MRLTVLAALVLSCVALAGCSYDRGAYVPPDPYNHYDRRNDQRYWPFYPPQPPAYRQLSSP